MRGAALFSIVTVAAPLLGGCATEPASGLPDTTVPDATAPAPSGTTADECQEFTTPVIIGGQQQQATGLACRQPDGSWRISLSPEGGGQPPTVFMLPPPPLAYAPGYYWPPPYWSPAFVGLGFGTAFVFDHHHHHRHFHHFDHRRFDDGRFMHGGRFRR